MIYILGGIVEGGNVLVLNNDNSFVGTDNAAEAPKMLPNYNGYHVAGTTWSASATISWMHTQPRIFQFEDMKALEDSLLDMKVLQVSSMATRPIRVTKLKPDIPLTVFKEAALIDEGVETAKPFWEKNS